MADMPSVPHPKRRLDSLELAARKGLGQHFLTDMGALSRIVKAAELDKADTVVEVGPGLGVLTRELIEQAGRVIAVELDKELARALEEQFAGAENLVVVNGDILDMTPDELLKGISGGYKVVAFTHVDTSTAVGTDVKGLAALGREHGVLVVVDGVGA